MSFLREPAPSAGQREMYDEDIAEERLRLEQQSTLGSSAWTERAVHGPDPCRWGGRRVDEPGEGGARPRPGLGHRRLLLQFRLEPMADGVGRR